jgi:hypothetical protein
MNNFRNCLLNLFPCFLILITFLISKIHFPYLLFLITFLISYFKLLPINDIILTNLLNASQTFEFKKVIQDNCQNHPN